MTDACDEVMSKRTLVMSKCIHVLVVSKQLERGFKLLRKETTSVEICFSLHFSAQECICLRDYCDFIAL